MKSREKNDLDTTHTIAPDIIPPLPRPDTALPPTKVSELRDMAQITEPPAKISTDMNKAIFENTPAAFPRAG